MYALLLEQFSIYRHAALVHCTLLFNSCVSDKTLSEYNFAFNSAYDIMQTNLK